MTNDNDSQQPTTPHMNDAQQDSELDLSLEGFDAVDAEPAAAADPMTELQNKLAEAEKQHLLAVAELDNFRRRSRQTAQEQLRYASLPMMNELLESVDNLDRAIGAAEEGSKSSGLLEGVKMVAEQISGILTNHGCKKIEAVGQPFDPNLHQAIQMQNSNEHPADTVMMELRSGFQLHDRVIRPSQVFVSTGPEE